MIDIIKILIVLYLKYSKKIKMLCCAPFRAHLAWFSSLVACLAARHRWEMVRFWPWFGRNLAVVWSKLGCGSVGVGRITIRFRSNWGRNSARFRPRRILALRLNHGRIPAAIRPSTVPGRIVARFRSDCGRDSAVTSGCVAIEIASNSCRNPIGIRRRSGQDSMRGRILAGSQLDSIGVVILTDSGRNLPAPTPLGFRGWL